MQELLKPEHHEEGRVPRTVECELSEDLVDACIPGDVVTVTGIIRQINNYMDLGGGIAQISLATKSKKIKTFGCVHTLMAVLVIFCINYVCVCINYIPVTCFLECSDFRLQAIV